jgi:hypothetical protein
METQEYMLCVLLQNVKIFSVAQQCYYGEFILPERIKCSQSIEISSTDIHKCPFFIFQVNLSSGSSPDTCEQNEGHGEANRRFSGLSKHD